MKYEKGKIFLSTMIVIVVFFVVGQSTIGVAYGYGYGYGYGHSHHDKKNKDKGDGVKKHEREGGEEQDNGNNGYNNNYNNGYNSGYNNNYNNNYNNGYNSGSQGENGGGQSTAPETSTSQEAVTDQGTSMVTQATQREGSAKKKVHHKKSIKVSSKSVKQEDWLVQSGKHFSKNTFVALYFSKNDGGYFPPVVVRANKEGAFTLKYHVNKPKGAYHWYAVDLKTGGKSKTSFYSVVQ